MQWVEAESLPAECQGCRESDCYNCDYAGKRWRLTRECELHLKQKGIIKTIERLNRQLKLIEQELNQLRGGSSQ